MLEVDKVTHVVDENLLRLGVALSPSEKTRPGLAARPSTTCYRKASSTPTGSPSSGVGWVVISNDRHLRTRPVEAELAVAHKLKVVHLHGRVGGLVRVGTADAAARWPAIEHQYEKARTGQASSRTAVMEFAPGAVDTIASDNMAAQNVHDTAVKTSR